MLRTLRVQDLAIIEELELTLEPGLNVITGETGAGKSILLQALDVALGGRPDADLVRTGAEEGVVETLFTDLAPEASAALEAAGIHAVEKPTSEPAGPKRTALWAGIAFSAIYVEERDFERAREILDAEPMSEDELVQAEEEAAKHPTQPNS